ncbi:hypothetical protein V8F20_006906 [Naviculisporaceae sp. PSN 640]
MSKIMGDAETIRLLRKELAKANDLLRKYRNLPAENDRLRQENMILRKLLKRRRVDERGGIRSAFGESSVERSRVLNSITKALASTTKNEGRHWEKKVDISKSFSHRVDGKGAKYVYHAGEPIELNERLSKLASLPHFMHPTQASEAKITTLFDDGSLNTDSPRYWWGPRFFLKKGQGTSWLGSESSDCDNTLDTLDGPEEFVISDLSDDDWGNEPIESTTSVEPPPVEETFRQQEIVKPEFRDVILPSSVSEPLMWRGLGLFQESFRAAARAYWPVVWQYIAEGPRRVKCGTSEMESYLERIKKEELERACPNSRDRTRLVYNFKYEIPVIRNELAHNDTYWFSRVRELNNRLERIQETLLLMGDQARVEKVRALRDEVMVEAERHIATRNAMKGWKRLPFNEVRGEDWDPSFPNPRPELWPYDPDIDDDDYD